MLPILHSAPGTLNVAVIGKDAPTIVEETRRWPDVRNIDVVAYSGPLQANDNRVKTVKNLSINAPYDVILLSREHPPAGPLDPKAYLKPGGIIQASTHSPAMWGPLRAKMRDDFGSAVPWREHTPAPLFGVISALQPTPPKRRREPPKNARRLNKNFLPSVYTFGKDEMALVYGQQKPTMGPV